MRVIAGSARGRRLASPAGDRVRPTLDRVRESLFNIWANRVEGARFLDLFAGSGAIGIEALSRGAATADLLDNHTDSLACIRKNLDATHLAGRARVRRAAIPNDLAMLPGPYDIIFADPPYGYGAHDALLRAVHEHGLLAESGVLAIEHGRKTDLPEAVGTLVRTKTRPYGMTALSFYA